MVPVVNGLEDKLSEQIEFRRIDANSRDGNAAFRAYGLRGHPAFVLLNPDGNVLWTGLGEQSGEDIERQLQVILSEP
jgi:hypothetical protein